MRSLSHTMIRNLDEYFELPANSRVYVCDLNHHAPLLIKQANERGIAVYGSAGRKPTNGEWISVCATGSRQPTK